MTACQLPLCKYYRRTSHFWCLVRLLTWPIHVCKFCEHSYDAFRTSSRSFSQLKSLCTIHYSQHSTETIPWLWMETDEMQWKFSGLFEDWVDGRVTFGARQTRRQLCNVELLGQMDQCTLSDWSPNFAELFSTVSAHLVDSVCAPHWAYIIRNVTDYPGCPNPSLAQIRRADSINISTAILLRRNDICGFQGWDRMGWDGMLLL